MKKVEFLKKFTTVSMAVLLALSATACFGDNSSNNDDDKNKKDPEEKGKTRMAGLLARAAAQNLRKERK